MGLTKDQIKEITDYLSKNNSIDLNSKIHAESLLNTTASQAQQKQPSWLKQNWRPITMLTFLMLIVCDSFGLLAKPLPPDAWSLLKIGLGGYVIGRSAEKILPSVLQKRV